MAGSRIGTVASVQQVLTKWHDMMASGSSEGLHALLAEDCVFWSPVVHTPQEGRDKCFAYLSAAQHVFAQDFRYLREIVQGDHAVLEFSCTMESTIINGVDMITARDGQIVDFKVMVRPLQAVNKVHEQMMAMLEKMRASHS